MMKGSRLAKRKLLRQHVNWLKTKLLQHVNLNWLKTKLLLLLEELPLW